MAGTWLSMTGIRRYCRPRHALFFLTPTGAGVGFRQSFQTRAALAQLVEHRIRNAGVAGSNPAGGTISFNGLADIRLTHFSSGKQQVST